MIYRTHQPARKTHKKSGESDNKQGMIDPYCVELMKNCAVKIVQTV